MKKQSTINLQDYKLQLPEDVFSVKVLKFASGSYGKKSIIPERFVEFLESVATELRANADKNIDPKLNETLSTEMRIIKNNVAKQAKEPLPGETIGSIGFNWLHNGTMYPVVIPTQLRHRFLGAVETIAQETEKQKAKQSSFNTSYYNTESDKRFFQEVSKISQGRE